jgi:hypothetical protein
MAAFAADESKIAARRKGRIGRAQLRRRDDYFSTTWTRCPFFLVLP